jgi:hypothetical protein
MDVDGSPALTDLLGQRVHPHERVRAAVQSAVPERGDLGIGDLAHLADLALGDPFDPQLLDELVDPPRRDAQQIGRGHYRDQGLLSAATPLQQPLGEVGTRPQLRDRQLDRPGTGVPVSLPVPVPPVDPLIAALAVTGPADAIDL